MNRTDRLLAIVLELQGRGGRRAADLAATFETSVRTIYRDIGALCEAGVPIVATPGRGYALVAGYFLPPLSFTPDEAVMLLLGADYMASSFDAAGRAAAEGAARKIAAVLPEGRRAEVRDRRGDLRFLARGGDPDGADLATLQQLRVAIAGRRRVRFIYHTRHSSGDEPARRERTADPYGLIHMQGAWYLVAHDHGRGDTRHFRLDRLDALAVLPEGFERPADFSLQQPPSGDDRGLAVRVLFAPAIARWVRESRSFYAVAEEETPEGLLVTLRVRREGEVLPWLLGWGSGARVLEPASLRRRVAEEAAAMLRHHRDAVEEPGDRARPAPR